MSNVISVKDVCFSYEEEKETIKGVSFDVEEGEYVAIVGHNGSGKSTLAKLLVGLLGGFKGEIRIFGTELNKKSINLIRPRLAIVFQNPDNQFVGSTVEDDIAFGLENKRIPHEEMQAIIDEFGEKTGMKDFLKKAPENLSGGQKQRVALAGVLAMRPELIILDEATSMLDPKGKRELLALVGEARKENPKLTIVSITHDIDEAASADKVIVMSKGEMLLSGKPNEVFKHADVLNRIHLEPPFAIKLASSLRKQGMEVPEDITTVEELEEFLCR